MIEPERFEVISRGDIVPGLLWRGANASAPALVLIAPPLGGGKDAGEVAALARACAAEGWCAAAIDLPLQGERANAKWSARLAPDPPLGEAERLLREELVRQAALDLAAARAALAARTGAERAACVVCAPSASAVEALASGAPLPFVAAEAGAAPAAIVLRLRRALGG